MIYDVLVIGAGHAGCEAGLAAARLGKKTIMFTLFADNIGMMSCNPSIGGPGKSHLVSEIDVLGGEIGKHVDKYNIQLKHLNESKGKTSRVVRAQADKYLYRINMKKILENTDNLDLVQEKIVDLIINDNKVEGVITSLGIKYFSKTVIITTGTFLKGRVIVGDIKYNAGREGEMSSEELPDNLEKYGIKMSRFQTATPPRLEKSSIDFTKVKELYGNDNPKYFSVFTKKNKNINIPTWLTYTTEETIDVVKNLLKYSPIVTGIIETHGPRHCPSLDRKVLNFPHKKNHQIFLEQESIESSEIYLNGLTTAMPPFAQEKIIRTIAGLENAKVMRYGYAVEYSYAPSYQLNLSLESKKIDGLFFAGQINGTSGYEEAAAQGFLAGVNAARKLNNEDPIIIDRSEGYIGVLIDDLINKKMIEPYRILPSRVEYKLLLRQDNAFIRLIDISKKIGIISKEEIDYYINMRESIEIETERLKNEKIHPDYENNLILEGMNEEKIKKTINSSELLQRENINYEDLKYFINIRHYPKEIIEQVEINIKYGAFINREIEQITKFKKLENQKIPKDLNYDIIRGLSNISKSNFKEIKPLSIGQASRISGVSNNDISILAMYLMNYKENSNGI
ncbi:MAG: tRNA uridine-5-carboxymethylaminomethyl(34) synthesis enzyme MnmG [Fusobacteria bacterium]|nr:tRNA uridine-5-carboxymethylaminomethyl(34) synthesis enzyme MnmG [Fusobacteriota bacterium]